MIVWLNKMFSILPLTDVFRYKGLVICRPMYFVSGQQIQSNSYGVTKITIFRVGYESKVLLSGERKLENYDNRTRSVLISGGTYALTIELPIMLRSVRWLRRLRCRVLVRTCNIWEISLYYSLETIIHARNTWHWHASFNLMFPYNTT